MAGYNVAFVPTIADEGLHNLGICLAFKQGGVFMVPHQRQLK
jgi:hypothetical protein